MRRYFDHVAKKEPHERRQHAMRAAGIVTAALLVVWVTTLGVRLADQGDIAYDANGEMTAAAGASFTTNEPRLEVSTTSVFSQYGKYEGQ